MAEKEPDSLRCSPFKTVTVAQRRRTRRVKDQLALSASLQQLRYHLGRMRIIRRRQQRQEDRWKPGLLACGEFGLVSSASSGLFMPSEDSAASFGFYTNGGGCGGDDNALAAFNPNKAFVVLDDDGKIIMFNSLAKDLLQCNKTLKGRKLEDWIVRDSLTGALPEEEKHAFTKGSKMAHGRVIEIRLPSNGGIISVSAWTRQVNLNSQKATSALIEKGNADVEVPASGSDGGDCRRQIILMEQVKGTTGRLKVGAASGLVEAADEAAAKIFEATTEWISGKKFDSLFPQVTWPVMQAQLKCRTTGQGRSGEAFPALLLAEKLADEACYAVAVKVYLNLSGLFVLDENGHIQSGNPHFTSIMFGHDVRDLKGKCVTTILPNFFAEVDLSEHDNSSFMEKNGDRHYRCSDLTNQEILAGDRETVVDDSPGNATDVKCRTEKENLSPLFLSPEVEKKHRNMTTSTPFAANKKCNQRLEFKSTLETPESAGTKIDCIEFADDAIPDQEGRSIGKNKGNQTIHVDKENVEEDGKADDLESKVVVEEEHSLPEGRFVGWAKHKNGDVYMVMFALRRESWEGRLYYCLWLCLDFEDLGGNDDQHERNWEKEPFLDGKNMQDSNDVSLGMLIKKFKATSLQQGEPSASRTSAAAQKLQVPCQTEEELSDGDFSERYAVLEDIGRGAFGTVSLCYRKRDKLMVVTKFLRKSKVREDGWSHTPFRQGRMVPLEASFLLSLNHPNIVRMLDVCENASSIQLVMEKHGSGMDLFEFIDREPNMDEPLASYLFRQGILHRDIKDENVIVDEQFRTKLIDFGSAAHTLKSGNAFTQFFGTVEYCSPEVLLGHPYRGPELEAWSLGVLLYVLIFWENPFHGVEETVKCKLRTPLPTPVTSELESLIQGGLTKDPRKRMTVTAISEHEWVKQKVNVKKYKFGDIINCTHDELYPLYYYVDEDPSCSSSANNSYDIIS